MNACLVMEGELDEHQKIQSQVLVLLLFSNVTLNKSRSLSEPGVTSKNMPISEGCSEDQRG